MNHPNPKMAAKALNAFEVAVYQHFCAAVLDMRHKPDFVTQHIPGAFHIDLAQSLREQIESVGSANTPLVLLLADTAQPAQYEALLLRSRQSGIRTFPAI
ncbi:MAG: rhodanese-like domain-containing protein [Aggregatilineales bacterium]